MFYFPLTAFKSRGDGASDSLEKQMIKHGTPGYKASELSTTA